VISYFKDRLNNHAGFKFVQQPVCKNLCFYIIHITSTIDGSARNIALWWRLQLMASCSSVCDIFSVGILSTCPWFSTICLNTQASVLRVVVFMYWWLFIMCEHQCIIDIIYNVHKYKKVLWKWFWDYRLCCFNACNMSLKKMIQSLTCFVPLAIWAILRIWYCLKGLCLKITVLKIE